MDAELGIVVSQWWASLTTLAGVHYYGRARVSAGATLGLVSQLGWWSFMFLTSSWGLAPLNLAMLLTHVNNLRISRRYER